MKSFVAVGCLLLVAATIRADDTLNVIETLKEHYEPCAKEQNLPLEELVKVELRTLEGEDQMKIGCLNACVMKRLDIMEGSELKLEKLQEIMEKLLNGDAEKVAVKMDIIRKCVEEVKSKTDECEIGYELSHCLHSNDKW